MKYGVTKNTLLIIAGLVWIIAGSNILRIGITTWINNPQDNLIKIIEATIIFTLFFLLIFKKLYNKHSKRILAKERRTNCPFSFFDVKGWILMTIMMTFGIIVRLFQWLPDRFIAVFYTGLSIALILTGLLFIYDWLRKK